MVYLGDIGRCYIPMKKILLHTVGILLMIQLGLLYTSAQERLVTPAEQEACRVEVNTLIAQKEKDLESRLNGFLTSYKLSPLDMIVRSKQSLSVFDDELAVLCSSYATKQASGGTVGKACDNRIEPICTSIAEDSKKRMKVATKEALYVSTGRQRLFYMAQDINMLSKAINGQTRVLTVVDDLLRTIAQKINYFTDKIVR